MNDEYSSNYRYTNNNTTLLGNLKKFLTTIYKAINATEYVLLKTLSFLYWESEQK